ncbi:TPA: HIRAN domain-containing protein [Streptococcus equi subsp. zooepidemicus]|nr:HIRAN domain-containing protein [Streptococcus equi subsp. zooepidemicus]
MKKEVFNSSFQVAGTIYHQKEVTKVAEILSSNIYYKGLTNQKIINYIQNSHIGRIYKYNYLKSNEVKLVREPNNKYDHNAIKVLVKDIFIGYIPREIAKKISRFLKNKKYSYNADINIYGGPYKAIDMNSNIIEYQSDINCTIALCIFSNIAITNRTKNVTVLDAVVAIMFLIGILFCLVAISFLLKGKFLEFLVGLFFTLVLSIPAYLKFSK